MSNPEHLLVFRAFSGQSRTRPIPNASDPKRVSSHTCWIPNASDPKRVRSETHPTWNASNSERVQFATRPTWNTSYTECVQFGMPPIRNASGLGDRSHLKGGGPMRRLGNDHVFSGPMRGLKINFMARGQHTHRQTHRHHKY